MEQLPSLWYQLLWQRQPCELLTVPFSPHPKLYPSFLSMFHWLKQINRLCLTSMGAKCSPTLCLENGKLEMFIEESYGPPEVWNFFQGVEFFFYYCCLFICFWWQWSQRMWACIKSWVFFPLYYLWLILMMILCDWKRGILYWLWTSFIQNRKLFISPIYLLIFLKIYRSIKD